MLSIVLAAASLCQTFDQVLRGLEQAKARAESSRAIAEVRFFSHGALEAQDPDEVRAALREKTYWAFDGVKRFFGRKSAATGWDGHRLRYRGLDPYGKDDCRFVVGTASGVGGGLGEPIHVGYKADWGTRPDVWLADLVRQEAPSCKFLPGGRVQLGWVDRRGGSKETLEVVLDPSRGYMAEQVTRSSEGTAQRAPGTGESKLQPMPPSSTTRKVLEAQDVNGLWIPTHIVLEEFHPDSGKRQVTGEMLLSNLKTDFDGRIFDVFQPGDTVRDNEKLYRFTAAGDFEPLPDPKTPDELVREQSQREYLYWLIGAAAAVVLSYLAVCFARNLIKRP